MHINIISMTHTKNCIILFLMTKQSKLSLLYPYPADSAQNNKLPAPSPSPTSYVI